MASPLEERMRTLRSPESARLCIVGFNHPPHRWQRRKQVGPPMAKLAPDVLRHSMAPNLLNAATMKTLMIAIALMMAVPSRAESHKRAAARVLLGVGVGTLVLVAVFGGVLGWGLSDACYHGRPNDDGCQGDINAGSAGLGLTAPLALSLFIAGGVLYDKNDPPTTTASLLALRF